jgi:hypothetical protein
MIKTRQKALISAACLCMLGGLTLGACGIKPGSVSPPGAQEEGAKKDRFPRTYPDPSYDPAPALPPSPR